VGNKVFVTCYSGYGTGSSSDDQKNLRNDSGFAFCVDAATGKPIYRARPLGGGAGGNRSTYASMVEANGKLYALSRAAGMYVIACGSEYKQIACNSFAADETDFNGTPAICNGRLFLRSNTHLYCVQASK
jgi:outer membrane protein assembly factor BamB